MMIQAPTIFESYNARMLHSTQVAKGFIPPEYFLELVRRSHTLLIGPRGSGKTTLLKMLETPALETWDHDDATRIRKRIDFTGVFIPYDVAWQRQEESIESVAQLSPYARVLAVASFTTQVLLALVESMDYRAHAPKDVGGKLQTHRRVNLTREKETAFVQSLAEPWRVSPKVPSLLGLKAALQNRQAAIAGASLSLSLGLSLDNFLQESFLRVDFLQACQIAVERFDVMVGEESSKWALLFDELELSPSIINDRILQALRSSTPKLLFKISLTPYSPSLQHFENAFAAMPQQDFSIINLAYARKEEGYGFSRALLESILNDRGLEPRDPNRIFGKSQFLTEREESVAAGTAYRPSSRLKRKLKTLQAQDASFSRYLQNRYIDLDHLEDLDADRRASEIRKIIPLVTVRLAFRRREVERDAGRLGRVRPRKNPDLYSGATAVFAMAEGNPRWLIGIVTRLLDRYSLEDGIIPRHAQNAEFLSAGNRFRALLRMIPAVRERPRPLRVRGILEVIDRVGNYFFDQCVLAPFQTDPPLTFSIDRPMSTSFVSALGRALNAGAIVYIPDQGGLPVLGSFVGKRFRLSYLLAPYYRLPLGLGKRIPLTRIMRETDFGDGQLELL